MRWGAGVAGLALLLLGGGCQHQAAGGADPAPLAARFYLEVGAVDPGVAVELPVSRVTLVVGPKPVLTEYDIRNAEVVQVEWGRCLMLELSPAAGRDLYRLSVAALGRRLVLSLGDQFVGARRMERAMADGVVLVFVELPDAELPALVGRLKRASAQIAVVTSKPSP